MSLIIIDAPCSHTNPRLSGENRMVRNCAAFSSVVTLLMFTRTCDGSVVGVLLVSASSTRVAKVDSTVRHFIIGSLLEKNRSRPGIVLGRSR